MLLNTENIRRTGIGTPKLMPLWIGPFTVVRRVEPTAYELELAADRKMHDVFHVHLLKKWNADKLPVIPVPPTLTLKGQQEFEVHKILGEKSKPVHRKGRGNLKFKRQYLVSWRGQDYSCNSWEPESNLKNARQKIDEFWEKTRLGL